MLKVEFIEMLKSHIVESKESFKSDKPRIRMYFNDLKDSLHKDGCITDAQVFNWCITDKELKSILKLCNS